MSESMIKRVVRAIQQDDGNPCVSTLKSSMCREIDGCICRSLARAAIEAMREPNFYMTENGDSAILDAKGLGTTECWQAMIDAALSEMPEDAA